MKYSWNLVMATLLLLLVLPLCSASYKAGDCITISTSCSNCTFVNISSALAPNSSIMLSDGMMTKSGTSYNYSLCTYPNIIGSYDLFFVGDIDGNNKVWANDYSVTPSGQDNINSGQGLTLFGGTFVILAVAIAFFILFWISQGTAFKLIFISLSGVFFIIAVLFAMISITQTLGGFEAFVTGYTTFWFVIAILAGIAILALVLFSLYMAYSIWNIKRGRR